MKKTLKLLALITMLFPAAAVAKTKSNVPPDDLRSLNRLAGEWKGTARWITDREDKPAEAEWSCRKRAGGFGIVCELEVGGPDPYREISLFAFDQASRKVHWTSACSFGQVHHHLGEIVEGGLNASSSEAQVSLRFIGERLVIRMIFGGRIGTLEYVFSR